MKIRPVHTFMKTMFSIVFSFLFLFSSFSQVNYIRIKFKSDEAAALQSMDRGPVRLSNEGYVQTGIATFDKLASKYQGTKLKRVYRPAGKFEERHKKFGLHLWYELEMNNLDNSTLDQSVTDFKKLNEIQAVEKKYDKKLSVTDKSYNPAGASFIPNDPMFANQWHYNNTGQTGGTPGSDINLPEAWSIQKGSSNVVVAVIDQGIDIHHVDLAGAIWVNQAEKNGTPGVDDDNNGYIDDIYGYCFADNIGTIPAGQHGSHVAGTIGAITNNGIGVSGIAGGSGSGDGVRLMSCAVFSNYNQDGFGEAFVYAADMGAVIAQNSWGYTAAGVYEQSVLDGIDYFIATAGMDINGNQVGPMAGGLAVFAAGNNNTQEKWYPAYYDHVLSVAALDHNSQIAYYSNYGSWIDIAAPGGNTSNSVNQGVLSTTPGNAYSYFMGTSMACPHVSGVAALVVSQFEGPGLTSQAVWDRIIQGADNIDSVNPSYIGLLGSGRLNAYKALLPYDTISPAPIDDLKVVDHDMFSVTLSWTATGGSDTIGRASSYEIRRAEFAINVANFESATLVLYSPRPKMAGGQDTFKIVGLSPATTYYFAMKAIDLDKLKSGLSNVVSYTTDPSPIISVMPESLTEALDSGLTKIDTLVIRNSGAGILNFSFSGYDTITQKSLPINVIPLTFTDKIAEKDVADTKVGKPGITGMGDDEPNGFGYWWIDSKEPGGPTFDWKEISLIGTPANIDYAGYKDVTLPFNFSFYGKTYNKIYVSVNGFITFNMAGAGNEYNVPIPYTDPPNAFIAPFWDELYSNNTIYYYSDGQSFIVQYEKVSRWANSGSYTFQIILYRNGEIKFQYKTMVGDITYATTGIENETGKEGLQIEYYTPYVCNNLAVLITTKQRIVASVSPAAGSIDPGNNCKVLVEVTSKGLKPENYKGVLKLLSDDLLHPKLLVPVSLHVNGVPKIAVITDTMNFGQVFLTDTAKLQLTIINTGTDSLRLDSLTIGNNIFLVKDFKPIAIYSKDTFKTDVYFAPTSESISAHELIIYSNAFNSHAYIVHLSGRGILPPAITVVPDSLNTKFNVGDSVTKIVTINNTDGKSDLIVKIDKTYLIAPSFKLSERIINKPDASIVLDDENGFNRKVLFAPVASDVKKFPSVTKVLILYEDFSFISQIYNILKANPDINVYTENASDSVPSLAYLKNFNSIVVCNNGWIEAPVTVGNRLAEYVDAGGNVILAAPTFYNGSAGGIKGRLADNGYIPFMKGKIYGTSAMGEFDSTNYIMENVRSVQGSHMLIDAKINDGATEVASLTNGSPLVGTKGSVIALNLYIAYPGYWTGDVPALIINAINWGHLKWLNPAIRSITIPAGTAENINIGFNATGLYGGNYLARLNIKSNDPIHPEINVPVHMRLTGVPILYLDSDSVNFGQVFTGHTDTMKLIVRNKGTDILVVDSIDISDMHFGVSSKRFYVNCNDSVTLKVWYNANELQNSQSLLLLYSNDPIRTPTSVVMKAESELPPIITVAPDSLRVDLIRGKETTEILTINNTTGGSDLKVVFSKAYLSTASFKESDIEINKSDVSTAFTSNISPVRNKLIVPVISYVKKFTTSSKVLILYGNTSKISEIFNILRAYPDLDVYSQNADSSMPTLKQLINYKSVIVGNADFWKDPATIGNVLADYVDAGGNVILTIPTFYNDPGLNLSGRIVTGGYMPFNMCNGWDGDDLGEYDSTNHLMDNVRYIRASVIKGANTTNGAKRVASMKSGGAFVGTKGNVVALNLFIAYPGDWIGDVPALFHNSIHWGNWLETGKVFTTIPAGTSEEIEIKFDAIDLDRGDYFAQLKITSNDPIRPEIIIPAHLHVTEIPVLSLSKDTLDFGRVLTGSTDTMNLVVKNTGKDLLVIDSLIIANTHFGVSYNTTIVNCNDSAKVKVWYHANEVQSDLGLLYLYSNDTAQLSKTVVLIGRSLSPLPVITVSPDSFFTALYTGDSTSKVITIDNAGGGSDLIYSIELSYENNDISGRIVAPGPDRITENEMSYFTESSGWLQSDVSSGTVTGGSSESINFKFNTKGLSVASYFAQITINSNDLVNPQVDIPAHLQVKSNAPFITKDIDTIRIDIVDGSYYIMLDSLFSSPKGAPLKYTKVLTNTDQNFASIEIIDNLLIIDPLSEGKGLLTITADNNSGGTVDMHIVLIVERLNSINDITRLGFYLNNYPNPFKDVTNICYNLDKSVYIEVRIYNMQGQLLNTLVNGHENAGQKIVKFNTGSYKPGVYIYELRIDGMTCKRNRMIIE